MARSYLICVLMVALPWPAAASGAAADAGVIGNKDRLLRQGQAYLYDKFRRHPKSRYLVVSAGHGNTPGVATIENVEWLMTLGY